MLVILGLIAGAIVFAVKKKSSHSDDEPAPVPGPPGAIEKKYADALKLAMSFFDVQKCNIISFSFLILISFLSFGYNAKHLEIFRVNVWELCDLQC